MSAALLVGVDAALRQAATWRGAGESVALVRGSFDLLAAAHARRLAATRRHADRMVVAIRTDRDAAARLGPGRPVQMAAERARLVAALRGVDAVVIAGDEDAHALADAIGPESAIVDDDEVAHDGIFERVLRAHERG